MSVLGIQHQEQRQVAKEAIVAAAPSMHGQPENAAQPVNQIANAKRGCNPADVGPPDS